MVKINYWTHISSTTLLVFLFWYWSLTDRPSALGAEMPCLVHWSRSSSRTSPKEDLLHITSGICTFSCTPVIWLSAVWKTLFLRNRSYLRHFWFLEGSRLNVISSFCRQLLLRADSSLVGFIKVWVLMYPKRFMWCCANFGYVGLCWASFINTSLKFLSLSWKF